MGRLPPTRKYRKKKSGTEAPQTPAGKGKIRVRQVRSGSGKPLRIKRTLEAQIGRAHV